MVFNNAMRFKALTSLSLLLLMLVTQLGLAQHYVAHDHHNHAAEHHGHEHGHDNDTPETSEECSACVLTNGLAHSLTSQTILISAQLDKFTTPFVKTENHKYSRAQKHNCARAPPHLLS